jgi:DNA primase
LWGENMITEYLDTVLGEGKPHNTSKGLQYSYQCPLCGDWKDRLFINVDRGKFFCHNCESGGTLVTFISEYSGIAWKEALKVYREYETYEIELPEEIENEVYARLIKKPVIEVPKYVYPLPEEFILMEDATGKAGRKAYEYLKSRGISMPTCEQQYIGYCAEGKYANRIIMPDFENGELVYWQARTWEPKPALKLLEKHYKKVLNPSLTPEQLEDGYVAVDKSDVVSNIDFIRENGMAVICEGRFDSYTIGESGACIHGKHMSDEQFLKLVKHKNDIDLVVVMLDGDAFKKAVITAKRLSGHFSDVLIAKLPDDKDPNSLGKKGVLDAINKAESYSPMFEVKARLRGWT